MARFKDRNEEVARFLEERNVTRDLKSARKALRELAKSGIYVEDASDESGYPNYHVRTEEGMVRVYKNGRKEIVVQKWERTEFKYSGIPTFFSTGM